MKLNQQHSFKSKFHNIELIATEFDEPQPGNTLWRYKLFIDGERVENQYISYKYTGLYSDLTNYQMDSEDGRFIYIPQKGTLLLYDSQRQEFKAIPLGAQQPNNLFVSNTFSEGRLVLVYQRELQLMELEKFTRQSILFVRGRYHLVNAQYIDNLLIVTYKDLTDYSLYTKQYDFEKMDFEA